MMVVVVVVCVQLRVTLPNDADDASVRDVVDKCFS
jgi:hypothetical protein